MPSPAARGATASSETADVVLTVVSRGFRELLQARGESVDGRVITTLVPVSTRGADARGELDNRVSAVYARLPVGIADPVETLTAGFFLAGCGQGPKDIPETVAQASAAAAKVLAMFGNTRLTHLQICLRTGNIRQMIIIRKMECISL